MLIHKKDRWVIKNWLGMDEFNEDSMRRIYYLRVGARYRKVIVLLFAILKLLCYS